ncbi:hypothetical protein EJ02DRAFT_432950 [Clathrospora elynae]|uniref:Uncharacterized protein n=1 Tax=Clathrospora elynae TaxID=706981 RepID=A0A6A5SWV3_9PLEO|nr:hypothetical protein EJ02DRAFT_432950 [Clathrospora elynae]
MATQNQAHYPGHQLQQPQQHRNIGQQRQTPNGQQQNFGQGQQKGVQGQQQIQNPYANYDPQLVLFTLEKSKKAKNWEDVEPEQQHVALQELQNELNKFRRNKGNVKRSLNEIPSTNCRRIINELVEEQTQELWKYNRTIRYTIASVESEWRSVNRHQRQLKRVHVILETVSTGFQEPVQMKPVVGGGGNAFITHDPNKAMKQNNAPPNLQFQGQPNNHAQNIAQQQLKVSQQHQQQQHQQQQHQQQQHQQQQHMQQSQHLEQPRVPPPPGQGPGQMPGHGNAPPPPPPPGGAGGGMPGHHVMGTHLPPPPGAGGGLPMPGHHQHPQAQAQAHHLPPPPPPPPPPQAQAHHLPPPPQGQRAMPSSFPGVMPVHPGMRPGLGAPVEVMDPGFLRSQKSKHKSHCDSSESSSDSGSWQEESGSSSADPIRILNVEHGEYGYIGRRERGRSGYSVKSKNSRQHRSQSKSKGRSRSRSRSHPRRVVVDSYAEKSSRRRRDSDLVDASHKADYSPVSSKSNLSHSSHHQLPPIPIHIHMNTNNNAAEDRVRDYEALRERRASLNPSPTGFYKDKRKVDKLNTSLPMSRDNSGSSWERASGTNSFAASSAHTADDGVFDAPMRRPSLSRHHSRHKSYSARPREGFNHPHPGYIYDGVDRHPAQKIRYPRDAVDDYPYDHIPHIRERKGDSYFDEQPSYAARPNLPHRRNSMVVSSNIHNPFGQSHFPPKPIRASSYASDMHEPGYSFPQPRYIADRPDEDSREQLDLRDIRDALDHIQGSRQQHTGPLFNPSDAPFFGSTTIIFPTPTKDVPTFTQTPTSSFIRSSTSSAMSISSHSAFSNSTIYSSVMSHNSTASHSSTHLYTSTGSVSPRRLRR